MSTVVYLLHHVLALCQFMFCVAPCGAVSCCQSDALQGGIPVWRRLNRLLFLALQARQAPPVCLGSVRTTGWYKQALIANIQWDTYVGGDDIMHDVTVLYNDAAQRWIACDGGTTSDYTVVRHTTSSCTALRCYQGNVSERSFVTPIRFKSPYNFPCELVN